MAIALLKNKKIELSTFYAAYYLEGGVFLPFWPLWLHAKGLGPTEVGLVLGIVLLGKVILQPLIGAAIDIHRWRKDAIVALGFFAAAGHFLFFITESFLEIVVVSLIASVPFAAILPLAEAEAMDAVERGEIEYGKIRMWGTISFVAMAAATGAVVQFFNEDSILYLLVISVILTALASIWVGRSAKVATVRIPKDSSAPEDEKLRPLRAVLKNPAFVIFLLGIAAVHSSHSALFGYGSLYWKSAGISAVVIGVFWAVSVIAEGVFWNFADRLVKRVGAVMAMVLAGTVATMRWLAIAVTTAAVPVLAIQLLHAGSFGAAHSGAMYFIKHKVHSRYSVTAQNLYSAIAGAASFGVMTPLFGVLYERTGYGTFLGAAVLATVGTVLLLTLRRHTAGKAN